MKNSNKLLALIIFLLLLPFVAFFISGSFYYHSMKSFFEIDLLNHNEYYHLINGDTNIHEIDLKSFRLTTPKSFRYIELDGEDAFVGYIANEEIKIYFYCGLMGHPNIPLTAEETFKKYGQYRKNNLYDIDIDSVDNEQENIVRKIAKSKKQSMDIWLSLIIKPKKINDFNYEYYLTMAASNVHKDNEGVILKIFESVKIAPLPVSH